MPPSRRQLYDTRAVETTSYALLVQLIRNGVTIDAEKMVLWLNTMRMNDGGFSTTTVRGGGLVLTRNCIIRLSLPLSAGYCLGPE